MSKIRQLDEFKNRPTHKEERIEVEVDNSEQKTRIIELER